MTQKQNFITQNPLGGFFEMKPPAEFFWEHLVETNGSSFELLHATASGSVSNA
jgi:hypothetical protein